eukprot:8824068-Pyramimonas_sp.AAC.1
MTLRRSTKRCPNLTGLAGAPPSGGRAQREQLRAPHAATDSRLGQSLRNQRRISMRASKKH